MVKKKEKTLKRLPKLPKIAWWGLWFVGIFASLFIILYASAQIWVSTWQTYRNDEFGFSFRYPKSWYLGGTDITKKHFEEIGSVFFWVDKEKPEIVQGTTELRRSNGDVVVSFSKNSKNTLDFFNNLSKSKFVKISRFGNRDGYIDENIGNIDSLGDNMNEKYVSIDFGNYHFNADTLTYTRYDPISIFIGLIEHRIGSIIIDSFKFD